MTQSRFIIDKPSFDAATATASFGYRLDDLSFVERVTFPVLPDGAIAKSARFERLLGLTATVLGVSYYKLRAPLVISIPGFPLTHTECDFLLDVYENGLGEFYARNDLKRFGKIRLETVESDSEPEKSEPISLPDRTLLPIGGGKDSLVSVQLLEQAGAEFTPFAVNPKGPILGSVNRIGKQPLYVTRVLDKEMIRLGNQPGFYNGHVPATAIVSMIAALAALLFGYNRIALSNERSASEGNVSFDGREANHQHSKSLEFEGRIAEVLANATGGALAYFSLLRPYSEVKIAQLFARADRFDDVFSSCNRNFRLSGHDGPLWCGECPKCHFTFLILAPAMDRNRLLRIFGQNLLAVDKNELAYRELTGLAGQKPWECVGEILEAAACLWALTQRPEWQDDFIVNSLRADLESQYGPDRLEAAMREFLTDDPGHHIPPSLQAEVAHHVG